MYFIDKAACTGCAACYAVCPESCIEMKADEEGFLYPEVNEEVCISCDKCRKVCPVVNKTDCMVEVKKEEAYVVCHKDKEVRLDSSSGGAFTMFAQYVLQRGGIVCGAGYDDKLNVMHKICDQFSGLGEFRGSKYVQSEVGGGIFKYVKNTLQEGRYVLFTGTPCQVEGLLQYLMITYEKLITLDIACYGVASISLWKKYIEDEEKKNEKRIKYLKCRDKSRGWRKWGVVTEYSDESIQDRIQYDDPYISLYLSHNIMRYSCYQCKFRNIFSKKCDATMADCWGIEYFSPEMDDDLGASILFLHSEKIKKLWLEISSCADVKRVNPYRALQGNIGAWGKNIPVPKVRRNVYGDILSMETFEVSTKKYCHIPGKKEKIIKKYPNLYRRYAWMKSISAPLRLRFLYKKMMRAKASL